jgi:hypothetical protein
MLIGKANDISSAIEGKAEPVCSVQWHWMVIEIFTSRFPAPPHKNTNTSPGWQKAEGRQGGELKLRTGSPARAALGAPARCSGA